MISNIPKLFFLFFFLAINCHGQHIVSASVFKDKYWGYVYNPSKRYDQQYDTMYLLKKDSLPDLYKGELKGGVLFRSDGSFKSFNQPGCGMGHRGRNGTWILKDNIIIVDFQENFKWYFIVKCVNSHYVLRYYFARNPVTDK